MGSAVNRTSGMAKTFGFCAFLTRRHMRIRYFQISIYEYQTTYYLLLTHLLSFMSPAVQLDTYK